MAKPSRAATIDEYKRLPEEAQMALPFAAGNVPASAWPEAVLSAGVSWGFIITNGDSVALTRFGSDMLDAVILYKDELAAAMEADCRMAGGAAGGAYLDKIDISDMAKLSGEQWDEFVKRVCDAYLSARIKAAVRK